MKSAQSGRGFIPILILVVIVAVGAVLFLSKGNLMNSPYTTTVPTTGSGNETPTPDQSAGTVEIMLDPTAVSTITDKTFTLNIKADTKTETVTAADLRLSYDSSYLEATEIKAGTFLPVLLSPGKVTNGTAAIVVGANPTTPQKGTGVMATVTFKAKQAGTTEIMINNASQIAAIGKTGSVLGSTSNASVTIK